MRIVIQRVSQASVSVEGHGTVASIDAGMLILVGVENGDTEEDARWLAGKTAALRIFDDAEGVMNRSVCDVRGGIIAVSQFTLTASTRRGNRPGYIRAMHGAEAEALHDTYCRLLQEDSGITVGRGIFGADMDVALHNDGPVTIIIDSRLRE